MEVLACPHCDRMFHATPAILGKLIRCRECRRNFRVPTDPSTAELGREPDEPQREILVAVECVVQGVDARRCPACGRTFAMQPKFVGKRIRCRGCRVPFVVVESTRAACRLAEPEERDDSRPDETAAAAAAPAAAHDVSIPAIGPEPELIEHLPPVVHEDSGDVMGVEPVDEPVVVAVRPRASWRSRLTYDPVRGPFRSGRF